MRLTRRQALGLGVAATAMGVHNDAGAAAVSKEPSMGEGEITPQFKLSCAAYSFRKYLPRGGKKGSMTLHDLLDLAAVWRLDALEPTTYYFESEDDSYLHSLKAKAFKLGLDISGTAVGNNFCLPPGDARQRQIDGVKRWIDNAVKFGAPCIRVFAGSKHKDTDRETALEWVADSMKEACDYAGSRGVFLAIENHGYLTETGRAVLDIVEAVDHEWFGVNLDTGNFHGKPYENMALVAPETITVQVKVQVRAGLGNVKEEADFDKIVQILRDVNYRGYLALEYEAEEDPMTAVPKYLDKLRKAMG